MKTPRTIPDDFFSDTVPTEQIQSLTRFFCTKLYGNPDYNDSGDLGAIGNTGSTAEYAVYGFIDFERRIPDIENANDYAILIDNLSRLSKGRLQEKLGGARATLEDWGKQVAKRDKKKN